MRFDLESLISGWICAGARRGSSIAGSSTNARDPGA
jgi:hypothetical protein